MHQVLSKQETKTSITHPSTYDTIHQSKFLPKSDLDCNDMMGIIYFFNIPGIYEFLHVDHVQF